MAAGEIRTCKTHSIGAYIRRIGIDHNSATKISTAQIRSREIRVTELRSLQISAIETGTTEIGPLKIDFTQIGVSEVGITKVSADQMGTLQPSRAQITAETGTAAEQSLCGRAKRLNEQRLNLFSLRGDGGQCADQKDSS